MAHALHRDCHDDGRVAPAFGGLMMALLQGIFFLVLGGGLTLIAWNSLKTGWLPYGPGRFGRDVAVWRSESPLFYWVLFLGYNVAGIWMAGFALMVLAGTAEPMPLQRS